MVVQTTPQAFRAQLLYFESEPHRDDPMASVVFHSDGLLVVENGLITNSGAADDLLPDLSQGIPVTDLRPCLLMPGFVDAHIHYVQTDVIASYGKQLLDWLNDYTFPAERSFEDPEHCKTTAHWFLQELFRHGTTTALVMGSSHKVSVSEFFEAAHKVNMRVAAGKVMMDRHCPDYLADTPQSSYEDSKALIETYHEKDRLHYAVTPRFAPTSSEAQLTLAGQLMQEHPTVYMQTHLSENHKEIAWVKELFPKHKNYLDVYDSFGLLDHRAFFAHCIHLSPEEQTRLVEAGGHAVFCPTSNEFLGSGLFDLKAAERLSMSVCLGTDVGGGTSFGIPQTLNAGYAITQLGGHGSHPLQSWYWATLGGAKALGLQNKIGCLKKGYEADFVVIDPEATPLLERRVQSCRSLQELLFVLMMLGDDRMVKTTFVMGKPVHDRDSGSNP